MGDEQISMARGNRGSYMNGMRADWNVNMKNQVKKTYGKITGKGHCRVRCNLTLESFPVIPARLHRHRHKLLCLEKID